MSTEGRSAVLVFHDDLSDHRSRALPRAAIGTAVQCVLLLVLLPLVLGAGWRTTGLLSLLLFALFPLMVLLDYPAWATQGMTRVWYEFHGEGFRAFRGERQVAAFRYADVSDWVAASPTATYEYWVRLPVPSSPRGEVSRYTFTFTDDRGARRSVSPPGLFRWHDRGGLDDVTDQFLRRLGPASNRAINEKPRDVAPYRYAGVSLSET